MITWNVMQKDILERLRSHYEDKDTDAWMTCDEAADEIARLREDLFALSGDQNASYIKNLKEAHENRISKYRAEIELLQGRIYDGQKTTLNLLDQIGQMTDEIERLRKQNNRMSKLMEDYCEDYRFTEEAPYINEFWEAIHPKDEKPD